jgi:hypothetical protein
MVVITRVFIVVNCLCCCFLIDHIINTCSLFFFSSWLCGKTAFLECAFADTHISFYFRYYRTSVYDKLMIALSILRNWAAENDYLCAHIRNIMVIHFVF